MFEQFRLDVTNQPTIPSIAFRVFRSNFLNCNIIHRCYIVISNRHTLGESWMFITLMVRIYITMTLTHRYVERYAGG